MKKFICFLLIFATLGCILTACAPEEEKQKMKLADVVAFADQARDLKMQFFENYEYITLGSEKLPLYYFQLRETDFTFSVGIGSEGSIEWMMLSHISGKEIYLFHKNPGILDPNATPYTEDAKSYDIEKFITEMSEE